MLLSERNSLLKAGWRNEGISWYTLGGAQPIAPVSRTFDKGGQKGNVYYGAGFGWVITPGSLANYAKKWYSNVSNISNVSTQNIVDRIINGNPVLYYGYSSYQANTIRNHCKVIAGYKDNKFLVYDPLYYSSSAKAGSGGPNKTYDRGAMAWVSITDFTKEWDGRAIGIS